MFSFFRAFSLPKFEVIAPLKEPPRTRVSRPDISDSALGMGTFVGASSVEKSISATQPVVFLAPNVRYRAKKPALDGEITVIF